MPTFELKPMGTTNDKTVNIGSIFVRGGAAMAARIPKIEEVVWSAGRSPVPPVFAGRIPEDVWARTFEAVRAKYATDLEYQRKLVEGSTGGLPFIPCCVCCIVCTHIAKSGQMQADAQKAEMDWLQLAQTEQANYQPFGISVTIATETRMDTMGSGSSRRMQSHKMNVGLRFEAAEMAVTATGYQPIVVSAAPIAMPMERAYPTAEPSGGLGTELDKLAKLHSSGTLTDAEYAAAKAKLLR